MCLIPSLSPNKHTDKKETLEELRRNTVHYKMNHPYLLSEGMGVEWEGVTAGEGI